MTITVNNVQLVVDEAMVASNDPDEVAAFVATYNASLGTAVSAITAAAATADFTTTQVAAQDGFFTIGANTTDLKFVADAGSPGVPPSGFPGGGTHGICSRL